MSKQRIDLLLVDRGLAESRSLAQRLVMAGQVRADGQVVAKPSSLVDEFADLEIDGGARFVSRGGEKLAAALEAFQLEVGGKICADVGASTGGFTDCLLQAGAEKVYAIDVGYGILHWKLRNDPRVVVMERTNARYVPWLPDKIDFVSIDASFISSKILLPVALGWLAGNASVVLLVKPQFEAGRRQVARGQGVVRDPAVHSQVLLDVLSSAAGFGFQVRDAIRSPVLGPKGNVEFLAWLDYPRSSDMIDIPALVERLVTTEN